MYYPHVLQYRHAHKDKKAIWWHTLKHKYIHGLEEIISENMLKFCTGDEIIMYQLIMIYW